MTRRQIIIIAGVVILLIAIVLLVLSFFNDGDQNIDNREPQIFDAASQQPTNNNQVDNTTETVEPEQTIDNSPAAVSGRSLARNFTARYLSYSSDNIAEGIELLEAQMTENMNIKAAAEIEQRTLLQQPGRFYGISAKVMGIDTLVNNETTKTYQVKVQLNETVNNFEQSKYSDYEVKLVNIQDSWLVDDLKLVE